MTPAGSTSRDLPWSGLFHLCVVYIVWGATYLAIRFAVREEGGFAPFIMAASRVFVGGFILLLIARLTGQKLTLPRRELPILIVSSILLWNGGNGLVTWAEQRAHSGYAALVVGSTPVWTAIIESILDRRRPSLLLCISLLIGFTGLAVLTWPVIQAGGRADLAATLALIIAPISWGLGSILQQRNPHHLPPMVSSGYQQLIGGVGFLVLILLTGETWHTPSHEAWLAWGFLVLFGSVLSFTSFLIALRSLPIPVVMTYAYVNPVIAVFLGWLLLREEITSFTVGGVVLILSGVAGVFRDRFARTPAK